MALKFKDYHDAAISCEEGTPGGDTYTVDGSVKCFRFVRSHRRAVWQLTDGISTDIDDIVDVVVDKLMQDGVISINDDDCVPGHGWMGCDVWDSAGEYVGAVGDRCTHTAGTQTSHFGYGRCRFHYGTLKGKSATIVTGGQSKTFKRLVQDKIKAYAADPNRMDLSRELGVQRAMLDLLLERLNDDNDESEEQETMNLIASISRMAEKVALLVDKVSSIDHRTALTANQIVFVQATVVDVMRKHLTQEALQAAAMELSERLGTKQAFGATMASMLGSGEATIDMPTTRRVLTRVAGD